MRYRKFIRGSILMFAEWMISGGNKRKKKRNYFPLSVYSPAVIIPSKTENCPNLHLKNSSKRPP